VDFKTRLPVDIPNGSWSHCNTVALIQKYNRMLIRN